MSPLRLKERIKHKVINRLTEIRQLIKVFLNRWSKEKKKPQTDKNNKPNKTEEKKTQ